MKHDEQTKILLDMLNRAMAVINDLAGHYQPCWRLQQEIDDLLQGIHELEGPQE